MTGIFGGYEHSLSAWNCRLRPASEEPKPFVAGNVCEACAFEGHVGAAPNGFRIEENQFTTEEISAEQIEQARRAIARFHEIRRTMIALGVIDEDPAPSSTRVVDEGLLQRYEQELTDARMQTIVAARAANDMRRVFLSDKEIQNSESDPESWEIAVTRAGQIRVKLDEVSGHPGLEIMTAVDEVKQEFADLEAEKADLSAAYNAFRDLDLRTDAPHKSDCALFNEPAARARPCTCKNRRSSTELLEEIRAERDELDATNKQLRGERNRAHAAIDELEQQLTEWKERARTAERGQPKFSRPVSPPVEDTDAPVEDEDPLSPEERN